MRRLKFIIPTLLLAGACTAPSVVEPTIRADEAPSSTVSVDSTPTDFPADTTKSRDGGILIGSGT